MFEAGNKEEILEWSGNIEGVGEFEKTINHLGAAIKEFQSSETQAAKKEEEHAAQLREKKYQEEIQFEKAKLEQKLKYEKKIDKKRDQNINAKLPKLVITHFKGTPLPTIHGTNPYKTLEFYESCAQTYNPWKPWAS